MDVVPAATDEAADAPSAAPARRPRPPWVAPAVVGAAAIGACALVRLLDPPATEGNPPFCPFKMMTGLDCPGCGATRSLNVLLQGDVVAAADHNLLFVLALPVVIVAFGVWTARRLGVRAPSLPGPRAWLPVTVVAIALFWALRLLPWDPFTWLASGLT
ncbi:MAG: DUF2752 domain-containing protein [Acidimicrobiales bacterium]|nr:DUF2752 domain-containing protein [Acidimicrobiales bacterium]